MKLPVTKQLIIGVAMLAAAGLALALTPNRKVADEGPRIDLETVVPTRFGEWQLDTTIVPLMPDPQAQAALDKIYNQTLARTYINGRGERIMLSVAYGGDQSDAMQVHKPEVCYPAAGFQVLTQKVGRLATAFGGLDVKRIVVQQGPRVEPVTYWIKLGDKVAMSGLERKFNQIRYGLTGKIPDGLLFRVSNISGDQESAFRLHEGFITAMLGQLDDTGRSVLIGDASK
jgi:EpsI family protein